MSRRRLNNEGSIFFEQSDQLWVADISLPNGKRKRKRSKKKQVVKEWLNAQRKAIAEGLIVEDEKIILETFLDRYLKDVCAHSLKPKTIDSYQTMIEIHIKPEIGHIRLVNLRPDHLQALYSKKLEAGLSKRTVQYIHAIIRRALNVALKWGLIYRNPANAATAPVPQKKAPNTLTEAQAMKFLETVEYHRWYPIYVLAITTGMREGEILGLRWEDVNLDFGVLSIKQVIYQLRGRTFIGEPKTDKARRTLALPEIAKEILDKLKESQNNTEGLIFTTASGKPISPRNLLRHFHRSLEMAEIARIRFHDLRHTCATLLLTRKVHPKIVQEMLGHSTITMTLDTYSHILPDLQGEAARAMDDIFADK